MSQVHLSNYQARDFEVVDYKTYVLRDTGLTFRGSAPETFNSGEYFSCVGAAQTFGCFCEQPYPDLLSASLGLPVLNLGYGGAGPEFFLKQEKLHGYLNKSKFVILQLMSGRSQSNSLYECGGLEYVTRRSDGRKMSAKKAFRDFYNNAQFFETFQSSSIVRKLGRMVARPKVQALVNEMRDAWVESYIQLISNIEVPVVLLWFSKREPEYDESFNSVSKLFGDYPQLVNREMVDKVVVHAEKYVHCVTNRGAPQILRSRFTGDPISVETAMDREDLASAPWSTNHYYPTPEMQEDVSKQLAKVCKSLL